MIQHAPREPSWTQRAGCWARGGRTAVVCREAWCRTVDLEGAGVTRTPDPHPRGVDDAVERRLARPEPCCGCKAANCRRAVEKSGLVPGLVGKSLVASAGVVLICSLTRIYVHAPTHPHRAHRTPPAHPHPLYPAVPGLLLVEARGRQGRLQEVRPPGPGHLV